MKIHPNIPAMRGRRKGGMKSSEKNHEVCNKLTYCMRDYLYHLECRQHSNSTIESHRWALKEFLMWSQSNNLKDPIRFTLSDLESYQSYLHQYISPRTGENLVVNTQLARLGCVRRFFAWMCRCAMIPANPAADLDLPRKQNRKLPKTLSQREINSLLAVPKVTSPFGLRDRAILELFYATGIRRSEMVNLDLSDYDPETRTLTIRNGKGGKDRMLPVGDRTTAWLERYLSQSRPLFDHLPSETALFMTGYGMRYSSAYLGNWVKKLMTGCGIKKVGSCHLFRHSCATDMHRGGADIRYVQKMLGHERMETTQIYTHVHIEDLRKIHQKCHPHGSLGPDRDMYGRMIESDSTSRES